MIDDGPYPYPYLGAAGWLPPGRDLKTFVLFEQAPTEDERAKILEGLPKFLRTSTAWRGPLLHTTIADVAEVVKNRFRSAPAPRLSADEVKELSGPDVDPMTLGLAASAMELYGEPEVWHGLYDRIHKWLAKVHRSHPIALFVRPMLPAARGRAADDAHNRGMQALVDHAGEVAALHGDGSPADPARRFMEELALFAAEQPQDTAQAFAPCVVYAFGTEPYGDAARALFFALSDAGRKQALQTLPPKQRFRLLLGTDVIDDMLGWAAHPTLISEAMTEFFASSPDEAAIDDVGFRVTYAIYPCARAEQPHSLDALLQSVEEHAEGFRVARPRLAPLPSGLRNNGFQDVADRLQQAVDRMV